MRKLSKQRTGLAHHLAHRTRYRISVKHRGDEAVERIRRALMSLPGVKSVDVNQRTGSVLVHHEERPAMLESIGSSLERLGNDIFEEVIDSELDGIMPGASLVGHLIRKNVTDLDSFVADQTNNLFDLKMLLPLAFLGAGIYKAARNRNWLDQVPVWVLFYYAYDSYLKFHGPAASRFVESAGNGPVRKPKNALPGLTGE